MGSKSDRHLSEEELLRYADGEIPGEQSRIARHLLACWECRGRLSDIEGAIKAIIRFRNNDFLPAIPLPPRPWDSLEPRIRLHMTRSRPRSLWRRIFPVHFRVSTITK
jgi:anti-sigma factor RsiW